MGRRGGRAAQLLAGMTANLSSTRRALGIEPSVRVRWFMPASIGGEDDQKGVFIWWPPHGSIGDYPVPIDGLTVMPTYLNRITFRANGWNFTSCAERQDHCREPIVNRAFGKCVEDRQA